MKKLYFFLTLVFTVVTGNAQIVTIPDANFKAKLLSATVGNGIAADSAGNFIAIDTNSDGEIQVSEALTVYRLDVSYSYVSNLTGIEAFLNLQFLQCHNNQLTSLNLSPLVNLTFLLCHDNQLTSLDVSNLLNLQTLDCGYNLSLNSINLGNVSTIQKLTCNQCHLASIDLSHITSLQELICSYNLFTTLDLSGHANLQKLYCYNNNLTSINLAGATNLQQLACNNNHLQSLNVSGFVNLLSLACSSNQIPSLDVSGLVNLEFLDCSDNQIHSLELNGMVNLQRLYFSNNQFASIDLNGLRNIQFLICSSNHLTTLDTSDLVNLQYLWCGLNSLTSLIIKNGSIEGTLNFSGNPNLAYICVDDGQIDSVQNQIVSYGYANCVLNSYCSFTPGGDYYTIQGKNRFDVNNNGCDASDVFFPNLKINITDGVNSGSYISNLTGDYSIPVTAGSHTMTPQVIENPTYYTISPASATVSFPDLASPFQQDFCLTANGSHQDIESWIIPLTRARPGFDSRYKIKYRNIGNVTVSGYLNFSFDDDYMDFVSATPVVNNQAYSLLTWNYTNLVPFETREMEVTFNLNTPAESLPLNIGNLIKFQSTAFPLSGDEHQTDNSNYLRQIVVGSLDPNDKTCVEGNEVAPEFIDEYVHYVIRFENTGTANAENIVVKDMIDTAKFDISTVVPLDSSHSFTTRIKDPNQLEFIFENINLPFDDANNDGYVAFKIKKNQH
ncbi:T9SS C-terminal target domain-containing protein [Flavobacterium paronense]|nr:T9SS C-terminal target domain-containing protein [Flavobacterium paronense]MDN3675856.1 T9SS C-terminal target domain-containing protein [Flavobacterium paronense]